MPLLIKVHSKKQTDACIALLEKIGKKKISWNEFDKYYPDGCIIVGYLHEDSFTDCSWEAAISQHRGYKNCSKVDFNDGIDKIAELVTGKPMKPEKLPVFEIQTHEPEQCEMIQKLAFKAGYQWAFGGQKVYTFNKNLQFNISPMIISHSDYHWWESTITLDADVDMIKIREMFSQKPEVKPLERYISGIKFLEDPVYKHIDIDDRYAFKVDEIISIIDFFDEFLKRHPKS